MSLEDKVTATAQTIEGKVQEAAGALTADEEANFVHYSDGSELIPAEIKSGIPSDDNFVAGYTRDDEGMINNYALEPDMSATPYPSSQQQLRYVFWGIGAMVFVGTILFIAFSVS
jgi:hypothetical protein